MPCWGTAFQLPFKGGVEVPEYPVSCGNPFRGLAGYGVPLADVAPETDDAAASGDYRKSVAVREGGPAIVQGHSDPDGSPLPPYVLHPADFLSHGLWRVHRRPFSPLPVDEQRGISAVEGFLKVWGKASGNLSPRGPPPASGVGCNQCVKGIGITSDRVLYV